eukprot:5242485-Amphidinium_carterae.1
MFDGTLPSLLLGALLRNAVLLMAHARKPSSKDEFLCRQSDSEPRQAGEDVRADLWNNSFGVRYKKAYKTVLFFSSFHHFESLTEALAPSGVVYQPTPPPPYSQPAAGGQRSSAI